MKILFTVEFYEPSKGGAQEVVRRVAESLTSKGWNVTVATTFLRERKEKVINNVRIFEFKLRGNSAYGVHGSAEEKNRYKKLLQSDFDIILNYAAQSWTTDLMFDVLDRVPAKKILAPCGYSGLANKTYASYFAELPDYLAKYDALIYHSAGYQDYVFGSHFGLDAKSVVIPNGASVHEFLSQDTYDIKKKLGISTPYLAITVANHFSAKGHQFVIGAFYKMKREDTTLLIIGEMAKSVSIRGLYHLLFDFLCCVFHSKCNKNIRLVSGKNREMVVSAYKMADLFLFGSRVECAPLIMYESFASQTPLITTRVGNIGDYKEYCVIVSTPQEMADAVNHLIDNKNLYASYYQKAYDLWLNNYTWGKIVDHYEKLFISLIHNKSE